MADKVMGSVYAGGFELNVMKCSKHGITYVEEAGCDICEEENEEELEWEVHTQPNLQMVNYPHFNFIYS